MLSSIKRRAALGVVAGVLGMVGTAVAASPALAYHIDYSSAGNNPVPVGTTYTATSGQVSFTNSSGGVIAYCPSSSLNGKTTGSTVSNGLSVTGGTFNAQCKNKSTGANLTATGNFSPAWQLTPTGGGPSPGTPFTGTITNVSVTVGCGSNSQTYQGTLSTGVAENNVTSGSNITLTNAQSLTNQPSLQVGSGCGLPGPYGVTGTYTLTNVGGSPVSSTNNLWLFQN